MRIKWHEKHIKYRAIFFRFRVSTWIPQYHTHTHRHVPATILLTINFMLIRKRMNIYHTHFQRFCTKNTVKEWTKKMSETRAKKKELKHKVPWFRRSNILYERQFHSRLFPFHMHIIRISLRHMNKNIKCPAVSFEMNINSNWCVSRSLALFMYFDWWFE